MNKITFSLSIAQILTGRVEFSDLIIPGLGALFALGGLVFLFLTRKQPKIESSPSKKPSKGKKSKIFGFVLIILTNFFILYSFFETLNLFQKAQAGYRISVCGLTDMPGLFDVNIMGSLFIGHILLNTQSSNLKRDVVILGISALISAICIITYRVNYEWIYALESCTSWRVDQFSNIAKVLNFQIIVILLIYYYKNIPRLKTPEKVL